MKTFKYAIRFLMRSKAYTLINLLGLSFSLACCIMLARYIHRELTVDTHCDDRETIYAVVQQMEGHQGLSSMYDTPSDSGYIDPRYIEMQTMVKPTEMGTIDLGDRRYPARVIGADSCFFRLFPYRCVQGSLDNPSGESVWVKEDFARKLFGKENPIGRKIRYNEGKEVTIGGVLTEPDNKTTLRFDVLFPYSVARRWTRMDIQFVRFMPDADKQEIERLGRIPRWVNPHYKEQDTRQYTLGFISLKELYWHKDYIGKESVFNSGERSYVQMLIGVCLLLFLSGVINFVNLYLVSSQKRGKEHGLKRVFGIHLSGLFRQLWLESFLLIGGAVLLAWVLIDLSLPLWEKTFDYPFTYTSFDWQLTLGLLALLPLLTSCYSLVKYGRISPVESIRSGARGLQSIRVRMGFLFVQYLFCMLIVILSFYFNRQLHLFLETDPGFRTEDILYAGLVHESDEAYSLRGEEGMQAMKARRQRVQAIDNGLKACPHIQYWTADYAHLLNSGFEMTFTAENGRQVDVVYRYATPDFFKIYDIALEEGKFDPEEIVERDGVLVMNRAAMNAFGFKTMDGARIAEDHQLRAGKADAYQPVAAVVADYYNGHLAGGIRPVVFNVGLGFMGDLYHIAYTPGKRQEVLAYLHELEKKVYGKEDFEYSLLTDEVRDLYKNDRIMVSIYTTFAVIAVVISCLGLFGLSLFDIRQRYREIGIRKVNGAKLKDIYLLLFRKYVVLLGASFVVAIPIAVAVILQYTSGFAVKAPIGIGIFVAALLLVAFISLGTLLWQVSRAARINPAEVVKRE